MHHCPAVAAPRQIACDIFCEVIDNFGDIGVCWRLARQLASEHGWQVRLFVDDLKAFHALCPATSIRRSRGRMRRASSSSIGTSRAHCG